MKVTNRRALVACLLSLSVALGVPTGTLDAAIASDDATTFTVALSPSKDNTLYEEPDGALSNGAGQYFFVGNTNQMMNARRRGLIAFDVAGEIPAGATIVSATLHLTMSQTIAGPQPVRLHRVIADWGEGDSKASGQEGGGGPSSPGDATWIHAFYTATLWTTPGGDFVLTASATTTVGAVGAYAWGGPGVLSDVLSWRQLPAANYGWLLTGNEGAPATAKRFNSREHPTPSARPVLFITYTLPNAVYLPIAVKQSQP